MIGRAKHDLPEALDTFLWELASCSAIHSSFFRTRFREYERPLDELAPNELRDRDVILVREVVD